MKKRFFAVLLALTLALGLLPGAALAAEKEITVYLSAFNAGIPVLNKEDNAVLNCPVAVSDKNGDGIYSVDEALSSAHNTYFNGGASGYSSGPDGFGYYSVSKFWGVETSAVGFYKNHTLTGAVNEEALSAGDMIDAYIYKDQTNWSDRYCYFSKDDRPVDAFAVCVNDEFQLTLNYDQWGAVSFQATAPIGVFDARGAYSASSAIRGENVYGSIYAAAATDNKGVATLSFTTAGTYQLTAQYDSTSYTDYDNTPPQYYLVPPLCIATVYENTPQGRVSAALDNLTAASLLSGNSSLDAITQNLTLPLTTYAGTAIKWTLDSPDASVIGYYPDYGGEYLTTVYIGDAKSAPVTAVLTAEISSTADPTVAKSKAFSLTVPAAASSGDKIGVVRYGDVMKGIAAKWQDHDPATSQIADTDLPWAVLDMKAYGSALASGERARYDVLLKADSYGTPNRIQPKYILAEASLGNAVTAPADGGDQWSAPSILLARRAAGEADNAKALSAITKYLFGADLDVDTTAAMLPALAPYYETDISAKSAADRAVSWLSSRQGGDGAWSSNSNSTAMVIVGLAALGIDAHTDSRFIKNHKSAVEGLLAFALADNSGFGYGGNVLYNGMSTEQGFRALVAYARFQETGRAYNLYLQAKDSAAIAAPPSISATTAPSEGDGGTDSSTVSAAFTLRGDEPHGSTGHTAYTTWISRESYTLPQNSTAADLLNAAMDKHGFAVNNSGGYVSAVTWNGTTLAETDHGPYSGWMFTVNGRFTSTSMNDTVLRSGDSVVWRYVDDYTTEIVWDDDGSGTPSASGKPEEARPEEACPSFPDVPADAWYAEAVEAVTAAGLFSGYCDGTFGPDDSVTRGQLAVILHRLAGKPAAAGSSAFTDSADWCGDALAWLAQSGIGQGYRENRFGTAGLLTREQLAAFLYRFAKYSHLETTASADLSGYIDGDALLDADAMAWAVGSGLLNCPADALSPGEPVTRAEAAVVFQTLLTIYDR